MSCNVKRVGPLVFCVLFWWQTMGLCALKTLSLHDFLLSLSKSNQGVQADLASSEASSERLFEGRLITAPSLFSQLSYTADGKFPNILFFQYQSFNTLDFSSGFSVQTPFGTAAKLHYDILYTTYAHPKFSAAVGGLGSILNINLNYAVASTIFEFTQSFLNNGFGATTRALQNQTQANFMASKSSAQFSYDLKLLEAEKAYWRLALARKALNFQKLTLKNAEELNRITQKRVQEQFIEQSQAYQTEIFLEERQLELLEAEQELELANQNFQSIRAIRNDSLFVNEPVEEELENFETIGLEQVSLPKKIAQKADLSAAIFQAQAAVASTEIQIQKNLPQLDLSFLGALNGQTETHAFSQIADTIPYSLSFRRPTFQAALKFSTSLDFESLKRSTQGSLHERRSAELKVERKKLEELEEWNALIDRIRFTQKKLKVALALEKIQKEKFIHETQSIKKARSTLSNRLRAEEDYHLAQLARLRNQVDLLNNLAQLKLFKDPS